MFNIEKKVYKCKVEVRMTTDQLEKLDQIVASVGDGYTRSDVIRFLIESCDVSQIRN